MADMYLGNESGGFDLVGTTNMKNMDFEDIKISKEDYEKLSDEEKNTGAHLVIGADASGGSADLITYNNAESGLDATNVQGAIDELNSNLGGCKFGISEEGKPGVVVTGEDGADSVLPFIDTSDATATAEDITEGLTAYVNGKLIIGTRPSPVTMLTGTINISQWDDRKSKSYSVTFETAFDEVPTVTITYAFGASACGITSVTKDGFVCWFRYDGDGSNGKVGTASWKAVVE